jgi:hypothetical protein
MEARNPPIANQNADAKKMFVWIPSRGHMLARESYQAIKRQN